MTVNEAGEGLRPLPEGVHTIARGDYFEFDGEVYAVTNVDKPKDGEFITVRLMSLTEARKRRDSLDALIEGAVTT